ncbi:MAG: hypothetical protein P1V20_03440 [Verrucomicrobiales bacterium]|nr:hypothetical protein [Verrucomicrobiales bacterium]
MNSETLAITFVPARQLVFNAWQASEFTEIHPDLIVEFERAHLVNRCDTDKNGMPLFNDSGICRLRIISDLREREKLSLRMMRVFCHMMDQLDRAETEVRHLRRRDN